jgi:hypothetical protein
MLNCINYVPKIAKKPESRTEAFCCISSRCHRNTGLYESAYLPQGRFTTMTNQPPEPRQAVSIALEESLRDLAKNMSAISRGGGTPGELVEQIVKVAESLLAYDEALRMRPSEELIRRALTSVGPVSAAEK